MNLGALARSLSNSLRFGVGSKKHLETSSRESNEPEPTPSTSSESSPDVNDLNQRCLPNAVNEINQRRQPYKHTVEQILQKVSELEHTLYEDQQQEFKLRMALERQTEQIHDLNFSLDTEKERNERLVQLLRGIDTDSCSDSEPEAQMLNDIRVQSKGELFGSISPLLMQQRYDELSASHRQTHRQLAKKEKAIKLLRCDLEELRGKHDSVLDEFRNEQRRLETLCKRYLHMQHKKKQQICILKETLGYASECILHAQVAIESCKPDNGIDDKHLRTFNLKLELFMRALRNCCCMRKLQELQQQQGLDVDEELLQQRLDSSSVSPSASGSSNCTSITPSTKRRQRKRHKR
ncbi:uncharacterized protein LOC117787635 [Drosophila innubila]|uniref:uncharacterized protein LOC117787635 n=1 Tax=Drosophila innubila TaxID=198719 RepID=UPI00148C5075|nr:uncharacterized protein LOC117787635 [Drosophila innubila]